MGLADISETDTWYLDLVWLKPSEIWNPQTLVVHIHVMGTLDLVVFDVVWGSFDAFVSKIVWWKSCVSQLP